MLSPCTSCDVRPDGRAEQRGDELLEVVRPPHRDAQRRADRAPASVRTDQEARPHRASAGRTSPAGPRSRPCRPGGTPRSRCRSGPRRGRTCRCSRSTGSNSSCATTAYDVGLTRRDSSSVGNPSGTVIPSAATRVGATRPVGSASNSRARTRSSSPQSRMISIDRGLTAVARGNVDVCSRFSTSITGTPCLASPIAVTSPAGPAPTTRTEVVCASTPFVSFSCIVFSLIDGPTPIRRTHCRFRRQSV